MDRVPRLAILITLLAALAVPEAHGQGPLYYGRNKVQYEGFEWHVLRTEHFDIYFAPEAEELAAIGAAEAEAAYADLVHRFDLELQRRVPMVFYATNLHFRQTNTLPGLIPPGVGGFFEFMKGRVVIPADGNIGRFRRVIRHELVHVFTLAKLSSVLQAHRKPQRTLPPLWFVEGLAEHWSGEPDHQHEMVMRDAVASNLLVRLEDMHRIGGFLVYKQGEAICGFIAEEYGEEKLLLLIENAWRDLDFRRVMEQVLGEDFHGIADRFDAWVRDRYYPMLAASAPPVLASAPLAVHGFSAKPVTYTHRDGRRSMIYVGNRRGHTNLYVVDLDEGGSPAGRARVLIRGERSHRFEAFHVFESRMDVSSSGLLAFVTQSGGSDVVHVLDLETEELERTIRPASLVAVYSPAWHPDGSQLAFTGIDHGGFSDLYALDLADEAVVRLTRDAYDYRDPAWHPAGDRLVVTSDRAPAGENGGYHLFALDIASLDVQPLTHGGRRDQSPRWSPDGRHIVYASSRRQPGGRYGAVNLWVLDAEPDSSGYRTDVQLTDLTSAALDPVWSAGGDVLFTAYDSGRFTVRSIQVDSLLEQPLRAEALDPAGASGEAWQHPSRSLAGGERERLRPYRRSYSLDLAEGGVASNALSGTTGGAVVALSDMLGDDRIFVTAYVADVPGGGIFDGLNLGVSRLHMGRRLNLGYGVFRFSGLRFDRTDPDADAGYPVFFEQTVGATGVASYPLSRFQRIEAVTSVAHNRKEVVASQVERDAVLVAQTVGITHDNALYGMNGPVEGWKAQVAAGATVDVGYDNVHYYTLTADARHYTRVSRDVTLASWALARTNIGREARLFLLGGSWDLRGFPFLSVRGSSQWFTSHELRFPIAEMPSAYLPLLAPFGIANLRGALFVDAAHAWNTGYNRREAQLLTGRTLGSVGAGLRVNLFGAFVLRYDLGYAYDDVFGETDRRAFRQFFFGYDF